MLFDPTYNYGTEDLENDENLIRWKFAELLKNLITLSSEAQRQTEIIGIGAVCDEMAEDFHTYFTLAYKSYIDNHLLTLAHLERLVWLDTFFNERSENTFPEFWDDSLLSTNVEWEIIRQKAKEILIILGFQDLAIDINHEEKYEMTDSGKKVSVQSTQLRLQRTVG